MKTKIFQNIIKNDENKNKYCINEAFYITRTKLLADAVEKVIDELRKSNNSRLLHNLDGIETDYLISSKELKTKLAEVKL